MGTEEYLFYLTDKTQTIVYFVHSLQVEQHRIETCSG